MPIINGKPSEESCGKTLAALLEERQLTTARVVIECNGQIVPHSEWAAYHVLADDVIELVAFVGGG